MDNRIWCVNEDYGYHNCTNIGVEGSCNDPTADCYPSRIATLTAELEESNEECVDLRMKNIALTEERDALKAEVERLRLSHRDGCPCCMEWSKCQKEKR